MTLAEALKSIRQRTGLSAKKFAPFIPVNQFKLQKWESGAANPKAEDSAAILKFLRIGGVEELTEEVLNEAVSRVNALKDNSYQKSNETETLNHVTDQGGITISDKYVRLLETTNRTLRETLEKFAQSDLNNSVANEINARANEKYADSINIQAQIIDRLTAGNGAGVASM